METMKRIYWWLIVAAEKTSTALLWTGLFLMNPLYYFMSSYGKHKAATWSWVYMWVWTLAMMAPVVSLWIIALVLMMFILYG